MEQDTLKFKTDLNCGNCVSKVQKELDTLLGEGNWKVDTAHADKILTTTSTQIDSEQIIEAVESYGFEAERI